jgi:hypothetical protein
MKIKYTMEIEHPETEEMIEVEIVASVHYQIDHNNFTQDSEFDITSIKCYHLDIQFDYDDLHRIEQRNIEERGFDVYFSNKG